MLLGMLERDMKIDCILFCDTGLEFPGLWEQLKTWDKRTWRNFRADYSVENLEVRFLLEREWTAAGKSIRSRAFYTALRERLEASR